MDTPGQLERAELLHVAIARNNFDLVRELLETYHLDPNATSSLGLTPLHLAAWEGNVAVVVCLLMHKAEVGLTERGMGWTALHLAARRGHEEVFAALVEAGADLDARDCLGCTTLAYAVIGGSATIVHFLLQSGVSVDHLPSTLPPNTEPTVVPCTSALHLASAQGSTELVRLLLDYKASINLCDAAGRTALASAVLHLHRDVVDELLSRGAAVDAQDNTGTTALHHAVGLAVRGREETRALAWDIVELLLKNGANLELKDQREVTPSGIVVDGPAQEKLATLARQSRKRTANSVLCLSVIGLATSFVMLSRLRG